MAGVVMQANGDDFTLGDQLMAQNDQQRIHTIPK